MKMLRSVGVFSLAEELASKRTIFWSCLPFFLVIFKPKVNTLIITF